MQSNNFITVNNGWKTDMVITKFHSNGKRKLEKYGQDYSSGTFAINYDKLGKKCSIHVLQFVF